MSIIAETIRDVNHDKQLYRVRIKRGKSGCEYIFVLADSRNYIEKHYKKRVENIQLLTSCPYELLIT